jgi:hypothetical protein
MDESKFWLDRAIGDLEASLREKPHENVRTVLAMCKALRAGLSLKSVQDSTRSFQVAEARVSRCVSMAREGDHVEGTAEAEKLAAVGGLSSKHVYELARALALSVDAARQDTKLPRGEGERLAERYATRALALLARLGAEGFFRSPDKLKQLQEDPDFDSLRSRPDFKPFLADLEKK